MEPSSPWGVSEKLSELCKGNFASAGSGSMGMRQDELANSSLSGEDGRKERRLKRISIILLIVEKFGDPKGTRLPFLGKPKRSLQEIAIGILQAQRAS